MKVNSFLKVVLCLSLVPLAAFAGWAVQTSGTASALKDVDFVSANCGWIVGGNWYQSNDAVILQTTNGGTSWINQTPANIPDGIDGLDGVSFADSLTGWAVGVDTFRCSLIIKTTNGGLTWLRQSAPIDTPSPVSISCVNANNAWTCPGGPYTMAFQQIIFHTTNGGSSWSVQGWDNYDGGGARVFFVDQQYGFVAGGTEMTPTTRGYIMRTTNGGATWGESYHWGAYIPFTWPLMTGVHFPAGYQHGWGCGNLYAMGSDYELRIVYTTDAGLNWDELQVIDDTTIGMLSDIHMADMQNGWVVGDGGEILRTTDGFNTFHLDTSGVTNDLEAVDFADVNNGWAVGIGGLILKYTGTVGSTEENKARVPESSSKRIELATGLAANNAISFWFSSPEAGTVTFSVCNAIGQRKVNEKKSVLAGKTYHKIDLPGNSPCGIYFLRAQAEIDGEAITKKFVLVK